MALAVLMSRTAERQVLLQSASNLDVADSLSQRVFQTNAQGLVDHVTQARAAVERLLHICAINRYELCSRTISR